MVQAGQGLEMGLAGVSVLACVVKGGNLMSSTAMLAGCSEIHMSVTMFKFITTLYKRATTHEVDLGFKTT